jgi:putative transposase
MKTRKLNTIWEVPDELWQRIEPILLEDAPPKPTGRKRANWRRVLNGILFRMRSGCQWNQMPKRFGDDSTVHRWFQRWCKNGVFRHVWALLVEQCGELGAVHWKWQSADGALGKARFGGKKVGKNPTDRGKKGTKRSLLVDEKGGPLGLVIDGANRHDTKLLQATIEAVVVDRPKPTPEQPQHLCLDKAYDNPTGRQAAAAGGYTPHIRKIGEEKAPAPKSQRRHKPRRWVVERTLAWLSKCRAILVRYDKHDYNYLGLVQLACSLFWYRRLHRLGAT